MLHCICLVFAITYAFVGLEFVVIELHDPFGDDPNDIEVARLTEITIQGIEKDFNGTNYEGTNCCAYLTTPKASLQRLSSSTLAASDDDSVVVAVMQQQKHKQAKLRIVRIVLPLYHTSEKTA